MQTFTTVHRTNLKKTLNSIRTSFRFSSSLTNNKLKSIKDKHLLSSCIRLNITDTVPFWTRSVRFSGSGQKIVSKVLVEVGETLVSVAATAPAQVKNVASPKHIDSQKKSNTGFNNTHTHTQDSNANHQKSNNTQHQTEHKKLDIDAKAVLKKNYDSSSAGVNNTFSVPSSTEGITSAIPQTSTNTQPESNYDSDFPSEVNNNLPTSKSTEVNTQEPVNSPSDTTALPPHQTIIVIQVNSQACDANQTPVKTHETKHGWVGIQDTKKGTIEVGHILTSGKANTITKKPNVLLDDTNVKAQPKKQFLAETPTNRLFLEEDENVTFERDKAATEFCNQPKVAQIIETEIKNSPPKHQVRRTSYDDSVHYTEDGIPHKEDDNLDRSPNYKGETSPYDSNTNIPDVD